MNRSVVKFTLLLVCFAVSVESASSAETSVSASSNSASVTSATASTSTETSPVSTGTTSTMEMSSSTSSAGNGSNPVHHLTPPYQIHSCLQMIGWCLLAAIGFFVEVHFPIIFVTRRGRQFKLSGILQLLSMLFALTGIILLIIMEGWTKFSAHKLFGLMAMLMRIGGFVMLFFREPKDGRVTKFHVIAGYARIVLTRGSFLLAIVTVYTGLNVLYDELKVPLWSVVLLSALIVIDIICETVLFVHASRIQQATRAESKRLITISRDGDIDGSGRIGDDREYKTPSLTNSRLRVLVTVFYSLVALGISIAVIVGAIYYHPTK